MSSSDRKSIICPNCKKLISSYETHCPYCGLSHPGASWRKMSPLNLVRDPYDIIKIIIYSNAALYILSIILNPSTLELSMNPLTFLSPSNNSLILLGATGTIPLDRFNWWWSLISASYLHGGILHILFNMLALRQLGPFVLYEYGFSRFFTIYTLSGIFGFFVSYLAGIPLTIGASASICGLIGATLYFGKTRGGFYGQTIYKQIMGWVIGIALFGFLIPGINNWGHGGGIIAGILLGFFLKYNDRKTETYIHKALGTGCILATILVLVWVIVYALYLRFIFVPH